MNPVRRLYRKLSVNVFLLVMIGMRDDCINNLEAILLGTVMYRKCISCTTLFSLWRRRV